MAAEVTVLENGVIKIEGAHLRFLNFSGEGSQYNNPGDRNVCVDLPEDLANDLAAEGWKIKCYEPKDGEPIFYTRINVKYRNKKGEPVRPPKIVMIVNGKKTHLDEDTIDILDHAEIMHVNIAINPRKWQRETDGASGIKGYLKTLYVEVLSDEFEDMYED